MVKLFKENYFAKLFMSHMALMILLVTVSLGLLLNKTAAMMTEEMRRSGATQLADMRDNIEREQLESFNSALLNKALSTIRGEAESEIQFFLHNGKGNSYYRITRFTQDLKTLSMSLPNLHNLSFYFAKDNFVLDRYYYDSLERSPQAGLLLGDDPPVPHRWFVREVVRPEDHTPVKVLSYVYTLPYMAQADQVKGYMIVDLDAEKLILSMSSHLQSMDEKLLILDDAGGVVAASSEWDGNMLETVRKQLPLGGEQMLKRDDAVITMLPASDSALNWHYALLRPPYSVLLTTQKMQSEIWIAGLVIALLGAMAAFLMSRKMYARFRFLGRQRDVYMAKARQKQWREALQGTLAVAEEDLLIPQESCFVPVHVKLDGIDAARFGQRLAALSAGEEIREEWLAIGVNEALIVYWSDGPDADWKARIDGRLRLAMTGLPASSRFRAGIGTATSKLEDLHIAAAEAYTAKRYGFLSDSSVCIPYSDIRRRGGLYPEITPETFDALLRGGETHELEQYLATCESELRGPHYSIEAIELALMQLHLYVSKANMLLAGNDAEENAPVEFKLPDTLGEAFRGLRSLGLAIVEQRSEKKNERYGRIFSGMQDYIDAHIDEDISLEQLTDLTGYSKQFVCRLFKEEIGMTFVEYMTLKRLELAAQLLQTTDDPIGAIAERSGFRSSQYFSNKFKGKYGVTPVQYRQARGDIQILHKKFKLFNG